METINISIEELHMLLGKQYVEIYALQRQVLLLQKKLAELAKPEAKAAQ